jgi:hypothetical protein
MQGNLGSSAAVIFEGSRVEGNDSGDDDTEILHSNDDFEMSRTSPDCSPSTPQGNTASVSSRCSGSTGKRQKCKSDNIGMEFLQLEREELKIYEKAISNEESDNPDMSFFKT